MFKKQPIRVLWGAPADAYDGRVLDVFDVIEGGRVVAAGPCRCGEACEFLRGALQVVAQLGSSPGEGKQLLHLWTVVFGSAGQEQSPAALAVCTSNVPSSAPSPQPSDVPSSKLSSQPSTLTAGGWDRVDAEVDATGMQAPARIPAQAPAHMPAPVKASAPAPTQIPALPIPAAGVPSVPAPAPTGVHAPAPAPTAAHVPALTAKAAAVPVTASVVQPATGP